ncbi:MAG: DUF1501 domain-containing protein [Myxococcales bacterium]|nr:DUF1501 domain-containing protein [Myxococcales bacterium]MCB9715416.1 DUF1501 domain-containing protein [Myxococcales bacterium]
MSTISKQNRRTFLKLGLGGIATGAVAPWVWTPRMSRATGNIPASRHNHLIVINLDGGARSVPMFNGAVDSRWNPYGTQPGAEGTDWGVGMVFDAAPHPETQALFGMAMPSLPMISNEVCVLGTVDHTPGAAAGVGNHDTARNIICSGYEGGGAGLMSLVYSHHKNYTEGSAGLVFPPVVIGTGAATTIFGIPDGSITPVMVPSHQEFAAQSGDDGGGQPEWARAFEAGLDEASARHRSARDRQLIERMSNGKQNVEAFRQVFVDPALRVATQPTAGEQLTNAQLEAILGTSLLGRNLALALRFVQYGSAAVLVGDNGWDTHSAESSPYDMSANTLARAFAGLSFALKRMDHPEGGSYWDHTLIMVTSEFGRDNVGGGGFNSGGGSDHTGGPGSRYQAFPYLGGLVGQGGGFFGRTDANTMEPLGGEPIFGTVEHMAMALAVLDINTESIWPGVEPLTAIF